ALLSDERRELVTLMHVMRDRPEVVEELAQQVPAAFALHHGRAKQQVARFVDERFEQEPRALSGPDVTEALVFRRSPPVGRVRRRREPSFVDAAAMSAERIEIVGMQFQPAARNQEGARHPTRFQPQYPGPRADGVLACGSIGYGFGGHDAILS